MTAILLVVAIVSVLTLLTWLSYVVGNRCSDWLHARYGVDEPVPERPRLTLVQGYKRPYDWAAHEEWRPGA